MNEINDVVCGVLKDENGEYAPVYCNPDTGACYFFDSLQGYARLVDGVELSDPMGVEEEGLEELTASVEAGVYGDCVGVVFQGDQVCKFLDETTAVWANLADPSAAEEPFAVSLDCDYEEE